MEARNERSKKEMKDDKNGGGRERTAQNSREKMISIKIQRQNVENFAVIEIM